MWQDFFTSKQAAIPQIAPITYVGMVMLLLGLIGASVRWYKEKWYVWLFRGIQILQLLFLYGWYIWERIPLGASLPLYHCRLAMLALLLLPHRSSIKQYFALMGLSGAIFALLYPVLDPYAFPHITGISFLVGHYALLANSLNHLMTFYKRERLSPLTITNWTLLLNLFLVGVNQVTGGNYGILKRPPLINDSNIWINYLAVSSVLILALLVFDYFFKRKSLNDSKSF